MIVEFQLRDSISGVEFQRLAEAWIALPNSTTAGYPKALEKVLKLAGMPYGGAGSIKAVRVRINRAESPSDWRFTQVELDEALRVFSGRNLDDQIAVDLPPGQQTALWMAAQQAVHDGASWFPVDPNYLGKGSTGYRNLTKGLAAPQGVCGISKETRNMLALQQCTGCHTVETGTGFKQIANRQSDQAAVLSKFLVGPAGNPKPKLQDLWRPQPGAAQSATVNYDEFGGADCMTAGPSSATRSFHDIARRSLFLAAVATGVLPDASNHRLQIYSTQGVE